MAEVKIRGNSGWKDICGAIYRKANNTWASPVKNGDKIWNGSEWVEIDCNSAPVCPDRVLVFQICNSNALIDDNFDIYLNDIYIGAVNLNANEQIGSVFIASLDTSLEIVGDDFECLLEDMVIYYFNPALLQATNTIKMINTQNNGNSNFGTVGVRNYLLTGEELSDPCVVDDLTYSGVSGANFILPFNYDECCPEDE